MSEFLERNKKTALVPLWLRDRRILAALLVIVVVVVAFVFVAPSNFFTGAGETSGSWSRLLASFGAAKREVESRASIFSHGPAMPTSSSVGFVQGDAAEMGLIPGKTAQTVRGILTPEDAKRAGPDVALSDEDLEGQRASASDLASPAAYAGRGFFAGRQGASGHAGEELRSALDGSGVPAPGAGRVRGGSPGRLSRAKGMRLSVQVRANLDQSILTSNAKSVTDLAQAKDRAGLSRAPDCTAANGCSTEYAATNMGAVYDGNPVGAAAPSPLSAPRVDGISQPAGSEARGAGAAGDEAQRAQQDLQACQRADAEYAAKEDESSLTLQKKIEQYRALGCPPVWGSAASRRRCDELLAEVQASCRLYNATQCAHLTACPLTASEGCVPTDCNSLLPQAATGSIFTRWF